MHQKRQSNKPHVVQLFVAGAKSSAPENQRKEKKKIFGTSLFFSQLMKSERRRRRRRHSVAIHRFEKNSFRDISVQDEKKFKTRETIF